MLLQVVEVSKAADRYAMQTVELTHTIAICDATLHATSLIYTYTYYMHEWSSKWEQSRCREIERRAKFAFCLLWFITYMHCMVLNILHVRYSLFLLMFYTYTHGTSLCDVWLMSIDPSRSWQSWSRWTPRNWLPLCCKILILSSSTTIRNNWGQGTAMSLHVLAIGGCVIHTSNNVVPWKKFERLVCLLKHIDKTAQELYGISYTYA